MSRDHTTDLTLAAQQVQLTEPYLEKGAVEFLFMCFASAIGFFNSARQFIKSHHFLPAEEDLRLMWEAMGLAADRYRTFTPAILLSTVQAHMQQVQTFLTPMHQAALLHHTGLFYAIATANYHGADLTLGRDMLQRFLRERTVVRPLRSLLNSGNQAACLADVNGVLDNARTELTRITSINEVPGVPVAPLRGTPIQVASSFRPTGVRFIDAALGGQRPGDANGLLGPTGGGKTTLAVHMATAMAKRCWIEAVERQDCNPDLVVYVTVEESAKKIRPRIWSAAFNIPKETLDTFSDWNQLSGPGNLKEYERRLERSDIDIGDSSGLVVRAPGQEMLSESERYDMGRTWLDRCFYLLDLSGSEEYPAAGTGYVDEIVGHLENIRRQRQQRYSGIVIDYVGLLVERYLAAQNMTEDRLRYFLKRIGDDTRIKIAEHFGCTVWNLHQLRGDVGNKSPTYLIKHTDAAESKDFANNLTVCGCLGVVDPTTGCRRLNWSKVRYKANEKVRPVTLRIDDMFAVMKDVGDRYVAVEGQSRFVDRAVAEQLGGVDAAQQRREHRARPGQQGPSSMPRAATETAPPMMSVDGVGPQPPGNTGYQPPDVGNIPQ